MVPQMITLLVVVAAAAALCGYTASAIKQRKNQRARRSFVTGFFFGFASGVVVRRNWRDIGRLAIRTLGAAAAPSRSGSAPQQRRSPALLNARR